jgi:hypothetical protein
MTAKQSFKIYELLQRHFKNNDNAKVVVQEIEQIIDAKTENKSTVLLPKVDLVLFKEDFYKFQVNVAKRLNSLNLWVVGTGIAVVGLIFSMIKLFLIK